MPKIAVLLVLFLNMVPVFSSSQQKEGKYTISGNIKGLGNDSVYITINNTDKNGNRLKPETMVVKAKDDHFILKGKTVSTKNAWGAIGGPNTRKNFSFYLEPGDIKINGQIDALDNLSVSGTKTNEENSKVRGFTNAVYKRILPLRESLKNMPKESAAYEAMVKSIDTKYDSIQNYELEFIKTHPNSFVSATLLYVKQDKLPLDELEAFYNMFPSEIQESSFGVIVGEKIKARHYVAIGNPAPDFVSKDTSGNLVRLSDFRGKYVLLEFWANWCVPCRAEHPHLKEVYKKYNDKGFTILQYSVDEKSAADKWKAAIVKDELVWTQTSDLAGLASMVAKTYGVQPIPDNFLIDPNGKIIARRLQGKELEKMLDELIDK